MDWYVVLYIKLGANFVVLVYSNIIKKVTVSLDNKNKIHFVDVKHFLEFLLDEVKCMKTIFFGF